MQKIAYLTNNMVIVGGIERILTDKINVLADEYGYDVTLVCIYQNTQARNRLSLSDKVRQLNLACNFYPSSHPVFWFLGWFRWKMRSIKVVEECLDALKPDVVVMTNNLSPLFFYIKTKSVFESHSFRGLLPLYKRVLLKFVESRFRRIVTLTQEDKLQFKAAKSVEIIPNFTNLKPVKPCNMLSKRVMAAGRMEEQKGFDLLIDAWKMVAGKHSEWVLDIYGEGKLHNSLQRQVERSALEEKVMLHPFTEHIAGTYAEHSIFVLSSRYEGFGLVLLEAMKCGMACIAYDCPSGPANLIDHEVNGLLVNYRSLSRNKRVYYLANAICQMIENEDKRMQMGQAAIQKADKFDKNTIMQQWHDFFQSLEKE